MGMRPLAIGNILINYMTAVYPCLSAKCLGCLAVQLLSPNMPEVTACGGALPSLCCCGGATGTATPCKDIEKVNK